MASFWQRLFGGPAARLRQLRLRWLRLGADMHSHLLPGLDDGAETVEHSLDLLRALRDWVFGS